MESSKYFCLKLKISITTKPIEFSVLGNLRYSIFYILVFWWFYAIFLLFCVLSNSYPLVDHPCLKIIKTWLWSIYYHDIHGFINLHTMASFTTHTYTYTNRQYLFTPPSTFPPTGWTNSTHKHTYGDNKDFNTH